MCSSDLRRELDNTANLIRLPVNIMEQIKRLNYTNRVLTQMLGREPSVSELAKVLDIKESKIYQLQNHMNKEPVSIHNLKQENHLEESNDD